MSVRKATNSAEVCRAARLAEHLAGLGVEGGIQRERAVTKVFKAVSFGASRGQRQNRILAIQGLDRRPFIDAEHRRVRRRVQIQPNNVGRLLLEIRIVRGHVAFHAMRLQSVLTPHPRHHHVADIQTCTEFARAPMRYSTLGAWRVASRIRASSSGVSTVATCPKCRLYSPAMRCSVNRLLQLATKPRLQSMRSDTSSHVWPSASNKINRARRASSARSVRLVARRVNSLSSEFVKVIASLMDTTTVYKWLLQSTSTHGPQRAQNEPIQQRRIDLTQ